MSLLTAADPNPLSMSQFAPADGGLRVFVTSLACRLDIPHGADRILDVGFRETPYHVEALRGLIGGGRTVAARSESDGDFARLFAWLLQPLLPRHEISGKIYSMNATGCHRSLLAPNGSAKQHAAA